MHEDLKYRFLLPQVAVCVGFLLLALSARAAERAVPQVPERAERLRVLIDTDAACEIDDLYAIGLALASPDRFTIEGFVAGHFGDAGGPRGIEKSEAAIRVLLEKAGKAGRFPVKRGSPPFQYSTVPVESEGVDFIIERALANEKAPLWIVSLGACTDVACAWLKRPEIARRVVVFWHGRTQFWPEKCWNFNVDNDLKAVRVLFTSDLPLVLFDIGTDLTCPMSESEQWLRPCGELGAYLHDFRRHR